jgi:hypothetical protein
MARLPTVLLVAALVLPAPGTGSAQQDDNAFPRTKWYGRATVQYEDERVKALAIYDYSQFNHESRWLLVQVGVALRERALVKRDHLRLVAPNGRVVGLATQQEFVADGAALRRFRQNAGIYQRDLADLKSYFPLSAQGEVLRFFALPGDGIISEEFVIGATHAVVIGDLYFRSPTGSWPDGTYRLVFDHEHGRAELPIRLE